MMIEDLQDPWSIEYGKKIGDIANASYGSALVIVIHVLIGCYL